MMATASELASSKIKCPVCGSSVNEVDLGRAGISSEELTILKRQIKQGTLGTMLRLIDIAMRRIDPERMNQELVIKEAIAEFTRTVNGLNERILGPAIGKVGEMITVKDFKRIASMDLFSEEKASKQGTDIVVTVMDNKISLGKVAISVKYDNSWRSEFLNQLTKNMKQEGTKFGILVTKVFPNEALSDKAYVREDRAGNIMLVAKPEHAAVAYYGFRQAVIAWNQAEKFVRNAESQLKAHQNIATTVMEWVKGRQFKTVMNKIATACEFTDKTDQVADNMKDYIDRHTAQIKSHQGEIRNNLIDAEEIAQELQRLLNVGNGRDGKKNHLTNYNRR